MSIFSRCTNIKIILLMTACLISFAAFSDDKRPADKVKGNISIMVLGSGGPDALTPSGRASASYLVFIDGKAKILMDAGGGSYKNLALSGVNIADLDIVLISHLHIDHLGDLSSFVKGIFFHNRAKKSLRSTPIRIFGPNENSATFPGTSVKQYPSTGTYVHHLYHKDVGIERYLNLFSKAINAGTFSWEVTNISPSLANPESIILNENGLVIKTIAVFHGPVPSLAFRIEYKGVSIVYSGDTNSKSDNMIKLSQNANMVIYDTAITDTLPNLYPSDRVFKQLHTTPSRMGEVCAAANPKLLLLSHITATTDPRTKEIKNVVRSKGYLGKIKVAKDLKVYNFNKPK